MALDTPHPRRKTIIIIEKRQGTLRSTPLTTDKKNVIATTVSDQKEISAMTKNLIIGNALNSYVKQLDRQAEKYKHMPIIHNELQTEINAATDLAREYLNKAALERADEAKKKGA